MFISYISILFAGLLSFLYTLNYFFLWSIIQSQHKVFLLFIFTANRWISFAPCSEENIYMLCKELMRIGVADPMGTDLYVVFISNEEKKVILLHTFLLFNISFPLTRFLFPSYPEVLSCAWYVFVLSTGSSLASESK